MGLPGLFFPEFDPQELSNPVVRHQRWNGAVSSELGYLAQRHRADVDCRDTSREAVTAASFLRERADVDSPAKGHILKAAGAYDALDEVLRPIAKKTPMCWYPEEERLKVADPSSPANMSTRF